MPTTLLKPTPPSSISPEEMERRRRMLRRADHENLLEGAQHDPATDPIFDAFIRGEIEVSDIIPRLKSLYGLN